MRSSVIDHPKDEPLIIVYKWQLDFCEGNISSAFVVGAIHLGWRNLLPNPFTYYDLHVAMLGVYSVRKIKKAVRLLVKQDALIKTDFSRKEIIRRLKNKTPQELVSSSRICKWCGCRTFRLQKHHYPIAAKDGGSATVSICANCHDEYHYLRDNDLYSPTRKLIELLECYPLESKEIGE